MRLLVVEDDYILGKSLKKALEQQAYGVDWLQDAEEALIALENLDFSAVILDVNLPKMSGLELLKLLRQRKNKIPVILLTALDNSSQIVNGLDSGADDYLAKPFDLDELLARLRALIRRHEGRLEIKIKCGMVELDPAAKMVFKNGLPIALTAKEFRVLKLLMEKAGKYISKNDIEYILYDAENSVESNTVEVTIYSLRKKLGADYIHSIRGVGYLVKP